MYIEHDRQTTRLRGFDYSQSGAYFVTICAYQKAHIFGSICDGKMKLSRLGEVVRDEWLRTAELRSNVRLDEYVVMPNHFHAIIWIVDRGRNDGVLFCRGTARRAPTKQNDINSKPYRIPTSEQFGQPVVGSIPTIIRSFKSSVTNRARALTGIRDLIWQRNYHEHIIRDESELYVIRRYIRENPLNWEKDRFY